MTSFHEPFTPEDRAFMDAHIQRCLAALPRKTRAEVSAAILRDGQRRIDIVDEQGWLVIYHNGVQIDAVPGDLNPGDNDPVRPA
jgi:hypothetical protein